ncbi:MAG TPA: hypothetical protein VK629_14650 [Steroidobacteraceae bacterium]|nr:hypothetical protein [Steroidobacteraceae bacterium]
MTGAFLRKYRRERVGLNANPHNFLWFRHGLASTNSHILCVRDAGFRLCDAQIIEVWSSFGRALVAL